MAQNNEYQYLDDEKQGYKDYPVKKTEEQLDKKEKSVSKRGKKPKQKGVISTFSEINMSDKTLLSDMISEAEQVKLAEQIDKEYKYCKRILESRISKDLRRLKLYNNQKRDESKVGDPLLFTVLQTVLSALYDDRLSVEWAGKEQGDNDTAENLNAMAEYDYDVMDKDMVDYEWMWDTLFFGRGLLVMNTFSRKYMSPIPQTMDPTVTLYDPLASSVNGDKLSKGAARFLGSEISMTEWQMIDHPAFFNINKVVSYKSDKSNRDHTELDSLMREARDARAEANNTEYFETSYQEEDLGDNKQYNLLEWWTFWKGSRVLVTLANERTAVVRFQKLYCDFFPIIDRSLYPTAHDWSGTSIPDVTEDKQRVRAIIMNLMVDSQKAALYPMYIYDRRRITNRTDLDFEFNKAIGVDGAVGGAIEPINQSQINQAVSDYILSSLDVAAQKATATPEVQQGVMPSQQRTLGELNMVANSSSARYSLVAKIFGMSERRFWRQWYYLYKTHFDEYIDDKIIRLKGSINSQVRTLTRDNFIATVDPDVDVVSRLQTEARRLNDQLRFEKFVQIVAQDPTANMRFAYKHLGRLNGLKKDVLEFMFPPTIDELQAKEENNKINSNQLPDIKDTDNHATHIMIHGEATETPAKRGHIFAHQEALRLQKDNPSLFPNASQEQTAMAGLPMPQGEDMQGQGGGQSPMVMPDQAATAPTMSMV